MKHTPKQLIALLKIYVGDAIDYEAPEVEDLTTTGLVHAVEGRLGVTTIGHETVQRVYQAANGRPTVKRDPDAMSDEEVFVDRLATM